jgi:hypothetical protein
MLHRLSPRPTRYFVELAVEPEELLAVVTSVPTPLAARYCR